MLNPASSRVRDRTTLDGDGAAGKAVTLSADGGIPLLSTARTLRRSYGPSQRLCRCPDDKRF
jgi:hypothetical protein